MSITLDRVAPAPRDCSVDVGKRELCALIDISYRQLDYWCRVGWLGERLTVPTGSGHQRCYTPDEVFRATVASELSCLRAPMGSLPDLMIRAISTLTLDDHKSRLAFRSESGWTTTTVDLDAIGARVHEIARRAA